MKSLVLTFVVVFVAFNSIHALSQSEIDAADQKCLVDGLSQEAQYAKWYKKFDNSELKKGYVCYYKELGILTEDGDIQKDALKEMVTIFQANNVDQLVEICAKKKDTIEDTAVELEKCLIENAQ